MVVGYKTCWGVQLVWMYYKTMLLQFKVQDGGRLSGVHKQLEDDI